MIVLQLWCDSSSLNLLITARAEFDISSPANINIPYWPCSKYGQVWKRNLWKPGNLHLLFKNYLQEARTWWDACSTLEYVPHLLDIVNSFLCTQEYMESKEILLKAKVQKKPLGSWQYECKQSVRFLCHFCNFPGFPSPYRFLTLVLSWAWITLNSFYSMLELVIQGDLLSFIFSPSQLLTAPKVFPWCTILGTRVLRSHLDHC